MITSKLEENEYRDKETERFHSTNTTYKNDHLKLELIEEISSDEENKISVSNHNNYDQEDLDMVKKSFSNHFLLENLDESCLTRIINEIVPYEIKEDETLFDNSNKTDNFYIIKQGSLNLYINDKYAKTFKQGESLDELDTIHSSNCCATVKANQKSKLLVMREKNVKEIIEYINKCNYKKCKEFLLTVPIIRNLSEEKKVFLIENMIKETHKENVHIIKENEEANCIYIIEKGEVECRKNNKMIRSFSKGEIFGEHSILCNSRRSMDVITKVQTDTFSISKKYLLEVFGENYQNTLISSILQDCFHESKYMNRTNYTNNVIAKNFNVKYFAKDETIIPKGVLKISRVVVVIQGRILDVNIIINKSNSLEILADKGQILFEKEVHENAQGKAENDLIADPDCLVCEFEREDLFNYTSSKKNNLILSLKNIPLFRSLSLQKLELLTKSIEIISFKDRETVFTQGENSDYLYIIISGKIEIYIDKTYVRTLNPNEYFGERAMFFNEPRSATTICLGNVICYALSRDEFKKVLHIGFKEHLIKRFFLQDDRVKLKDLDYVKDLDKRNYGTVSLVINRNTGFPYCIKTISKRQILTGKFSKNVKAEKEILLQIDHPFIVKLVKTLKDSKNVYLLKEYVHGERLYNIIRFIGILNNFQCNFYVCSLLLAIEYLHERKYLYRNIKPENVMVDEKGFIKLIEFGFSKKIDDRTNTILGTPHYMAPEIILGETYSYSVDIWSIAICMYEFKCGELPFGESIEDPMDVYLAIINEKITFPSFIKEDNFISLVNKMLCKNPASRLYKISEVKNHSWFLEFPWDSLSDLNIEPPYKPKVSKEDLKSNRRFTEYIKNSNYIDINKDQIEYNQSEETEELFKSF